EPEEIVQVTALACLQMDYPAQKLNIFILDDGGTTRKLNSPDPAAARAAGQRASRLKEIARDLGINYMTREDNEHAKAGNLNNALKFTGMGYYRHRQEGEWLNFGRLSGPGELVLVLDCDHVPTRDFLTNTAGFFLGDEKLCLVQTPHFFINPNPIEKNLGTHGSAPHENEMFYRAMQPGLDFWNSSFFCGSAALLSRKCLEEVGGFAGETVTEDAETALALHAKGGRSVYLPKPMICGLSPDTLEDFVVQRSRWAQGMIQILLLKRPFSQRGLSWQQRLCYTNNCIFWLFGLARTVFILAPLAYLLFGFQIYNASTPQILVFALPHLLCSMAAVNYLYGEVRWPFFSELLETAQGIFLIVPVLGAIMNPRAPRFKVTPKGRNLDSDFMSTFSLPFYLILALLLTGLPAAAERWKSYPLQRGTIAVCVTWVLFNLFLVTACLGITYELKQKRKQHRILTREKVAIRLADAEFESEINDMSLSGLRLTLHGGHTARPGDTLTVLAEAGGRRYALPAIVKRVRRDLGGHTRLGCRFDARDMDDIKRMVSFVYGESARWESFWRDRKKTSALAALFYLSLKASAGAGRNIQAAARFAVRYAYAPGGKS
nr:UDP-forming cellulose synthase catalytic subunit [Nitrospiraceae bacterium]